MPEKDLYRILGVPRSATSAEIRSAYRRSILRYHPDLYKGDPQVAKVNTRSLLEAYETLSNPETRREYDRSLEPTRVVREVRRYSGGPGGPQVKSVRIVHPPTSPRDRVSFWLLHEWEDSRNRFRPYLGRDRRVEKLLVLFAIGGILFLAVALTVPYAHPFALTLTSHGFFNDVATESFGSGAVQFSWQTQAQGPTYGYEPFLAVTSPGGVTVLYTNLSSGSIAFTAEPGAYSFTLSGGYQGEFDQQISGTYSSPLAAV